nr:putative ribonuclease h protein [Quercus suber]
MKVADLIDHELHCWKSDRVDAIFVPMEAKVIKAIPLSLMDTQDWSYWPKNRNGVYLVKSRYKLACEWDELATLGVSDQSEALRDPSCVEVFANIISLIWMSRNRAAFGAAGSTLEKIPEQARALVHEFHHLRPVHAKFPRTARAVQWKPPHPDTVKVNFDDAIFSTHSSASLGMIIRDPASLVLAALSQKIPLPTSMETVEVIATRRALLFARELGFERVLVEGDSEVVINAIKEKSLISSDWGHILRDIHALSYSFSGISFLHVKRSGNSVAHHLARRSFCNPLLVWMEEVPPNIVDVYNQDLGLLNE